MVPWPWSSHGAIEQKSETAAICGCGVYTGLVHNNAALFAAVAPILLAITTTARYAVEDQDKNLLWQS